MADELKPCPFCGELPQMSGKKVMHACRVLDKEIRTSVSAWNCRAERTCRVVTMDMAGEPPYRDGDWILNELSDGCSECGYPFDTPNRGTPSYCPNCGARVVGNDDR